MFIAMALRPARPERRPRVEVVDAIEFVGGRAGDGGFRDQEVHEGRRVVEAVIETHHMPHLVRDDPSLVGTFGVVVAELDETP
jgi:hypothetical protein